MPTVNKAAFLEQYSMTSIKAVSEYTDEQQATLVAALDDIHGNPHDGSTIEKRCYLVMAFTEYDDGIAASLGAFNSDGITLGDSMKDAAKLISATSLADIACSIAAKDIHGKMNDYTDNAQGVKIGAQMMHGHPDVMVMKCCLCDEDMRAVDSHNPDPLGETDDERCCESCNNLQVIPARIAAMGEG